MSLRCTPLRAILAAASAASLGACAQAAQLASGAADVVNVARVGAFRSSSRGFTRPWIRERRCYCRGFTRGYQPFRSRSRVTCAT
jgi:hypothetical protein